MWYLRGVIVGAIYSKRKDYTGFAFDFVRVINLIDGMVLYAPCDEQGVVTLNQASYFPDNFYKNRVPYVKLNKFVQRYEICPAN